MVLLTTCRKTNLDLDLAGQCSHEIRELAPRCPRWPHLSRLEKVDNSRPRRCPYVVVLYSDAYSRPSRIVYDDLFAPYSRLQTGRQNPKSKLRRDRQLSDRLMHRSSVVRKTTKQSLY